jgi:hypothetical protein
LTWNLRPLAKVIVLSVALTALAAGAAGCLFSGLDPVNKYVWMEDDPDGGPLPFDCDGPDIWLLVAVPSAALLVLGGVGGWATGGRRLRAVVLVVVAVSLGLLSFAVPRVRREMKRNDVEYSPGR